MSRQKKIFFGGAGLLLPWQILPLRTTSCKAPFEDSSQGAWRPIVSHPRSDIQCMEQIRPQGSHRGQQSPDFTIWRHHRQDVYCSIIDLYVYQF